MKFEDLSPADQALLNTDFGELDKTASEMVKEAGECYERGFEKTALEIADGLDKAAEEEKEEEKKEHDEGSEKKAEQLAAFYERGVFDGLCKLGEARHGDEMHYFWPFVEEKVAEAGAKSALVKLGKVMEFLAHHAKPFSPRAVMHHAQRAVKGERTVGAKSSAAAVQKKVMGATKGPDDMTAAQRKLMVRANKLKESTHLKPGARAAEGAKAVGKGGAYAAPVVGAAAAARHATKKDD